jgi:hypothetical protein
MGIQNLSNNNLKQITVRSREMNYLSSSLNFLLIASWVRRLLRFQKLKYDLPCFMQQRVIRLQIWRYIFRRICLLSKLLKIESSNRCSIITLLTTNSSNFSFLSNESIKFKKYYRLLNFRFYFMNISST